MIDTSMKLRYLSLFNAYPIVDSKPMPNLAMERSKIVLIAHVMEYTHRKSSKYFMEKMCKIRGLSVDALPNIYEASKTTGVCLDFINDYGKIQYLLENNPVMNALPGLLSRV